MEKKITICPVGYADGYFRIKELPIDEEINIYGDKDIKFGNQNNAKQSGYRKR